MHNVILDKYILLLCFVLFCFMSSFQGVSVQSTYLDDESDTVYSNDVTLPGSHGPVVQVGKSFKHDDSNLVILKKYMIILIAANGITCYSL